MQAARARWHINDHYILICWCTCAHSLEQVYRAIKFAAIHDVARDVEAEAVEAALRERFGRRRSTLAHGLSGATLKFALFSVSLRPATVDESRDRMTGLLPQATRTLQAPITRAMLPVVTGLSGGASPVAALVWLSDSA